MVVIRAGSRQHSSTATPSAEWTSTATAAAANADDPKQLDWLKGANPWNLFQRQYESDATDKTVRVQEAREAYYALNDVDRANLKRTCHMADLFPADRKAVSQVRFGLTKRQVAHQRIAKISAGFQQRLLQAASADPQPQPVIHNSLTALADNALANKSNLIIEDVMAECNMRIRSQGKHKTAALREAQAVITKWSETKGAELLNDLKRSAPPLRPMAADLHARPSSTHQVRSGSIRFL